MTSSGNLTKVAMDGKHILDFLLSTSLFYKNIQTNNMAELMDG